MKDTFIVALMAALAMLFAFGISWIATCGVIKLITLCFGWTFSWPVATGIWLIAFMLTTIFKRK